ncbi:hypothetical protein Pcinc_004531 [Petrolisthes cinctipes]|uniref:Ionotropic glutamate receptor C-terminal domain-containing protein n=1 Tax=Petrolisthes cinctipes TaxID=88211 RepID=A0AAE1GEJ8_PETCI|nr:hypothetical protein Pcinc_004531 [Petrolisthes cinctipes]
MCWVPRGGRVRLVGGLWLLVSFVIATVYRSNLKAMLILPKIQLPFTTFEQLAATDIHVVFVKGSLVDHALSKAVPNSTLDRLKGQTRVSTGLLSNVSAVSQGMTAGFGVFSALRQLMHNSFSRSGYCRLYVTTEGILHSSVALAFPKGSPLLPKFNKIVWRLKEFGLLQHLYHNEVANASECLKPVTATTTTTDLRPLELGDFYGVFSVYAGVFPPNSHSVPPVFPPNSNSVPPMFPPNSNSVPPVFPPNSQSVPPVFPPHSHSVPPVFPPNPLNDVPVHFSRPAGTTQVRQFTTPTNIQPQHTYCYYHRRFGLLPAPSKPHLVQRLHHGLLISALSLHTRPYYRSSLSSPLLPLTQEEKGTT